MDLSIIIVNYDSWDVLAECLASLHKDAPVLTHEILVVDNASRESGLDRIRSLFPKVRIISSAVNRGYAGGVNLGIRESQGRTLVFLNPDTVVPAGALDRLHARLHASGAGIAGPKVFYADGTLQTRVVPKKVPTLGDFFCDVFYLNRVFSRHRVINGYYGGGMDYEKEQFLGQVHGSCFMVKRDVIDRVGPLDPAFFLYLDEADFCLRAARAGYRCLYVPSASVVHHGGVSAKKTGRRRIFYFFDSQIHFFKKHYGRHQAAALYLMNMIGSIFRLLVAPLYLLKQRGLGRASEELWMFVYFWDLNHLKRVF